MKFRYLKEEEIECRIGQVAKDNAWITLLLYKDQRTDASVLDEIVGNENWQDRYYEVKGNLYCSVGIKCGNEWVWKDNCGTESNTEAEKGEASDAFKRACFNWGIGRELYTSPFIYIPLVAKQDGKENYEIGKNGKPQGDFVVTYIKTENGKVVGLNIENKRKHRTVFAWGKIE